LINPNNQCKQSLLIVATAVAAAVAVSLPVPLEQISSLGYSRNVKLDPTDFMNKHYHMTESLLSPVPMSTFDTKMLHSLRIRPPVDFDTAKEKAIYLVNTDCSPKLTKRNRWFEAVAEKIWCRFIWSLWSQHRRSRRNDDNHPEELH